MLPRENVTVVVGDCPRCEYLEYQMLLYRSVVEAQAPLLADLQTRLNALRIAQHAVPDPRVDQLEPLA